jgi:hypothetical protein
VSKTVATWWKEKADRAANITSHLKSLEMQQRLRTSRDYINERIYSGVASSAPSSTEQLGGFMPAELNFTRTIVDALVARVGNDRPAVKYSANGASWKQRRKAKQFEKVIEGNFECLDVYAKTPLCLRDCLMSRGAVMMVVPDGGKIVADRIPAEELYFDERESRYGDPRQMHRVMSVSKEVLAEKFPAFRDVIWNAPPPPPRPNDPERSSNGDSGMTEVRMSWHLPSAEGAKDGLYVVSIHNQVLEESPYERDHYPVAFLKWAPPRRGFWGSSLVDELAALQFKVNEVARDLMQNIYFTSALKIAVRRGADIAKKKLVGKKPHYIEQDAPGDVQWLAPDGFSQAQFQFLQWLIAQMFEVSGVSQLMAQGKNMLGAGASGAALNEVYEQDSERFSQLEQSYARFHRDIARLVLEAAQDLSEDKEFRHSKIRWNRGNVMQEIEWADVDLDADRFELHLEASGYMPSSRAGKIQAVEQLAMNGWIEPSWVTTLLDFPDLKRALMVKNAPVEWALWAMEAIADAELNDDESEVIADKSATIPAPDPHIDLTFTMGVAKAAYNQHMVEQAPQPILDRFLSFMDALDAEMAKKNQGSLAPAPAAPAMDPAAMGMPAPPPDPMAMAPAPMPPMGVAA